MMDMNHKDLPGAAGAWGACPCCGKSLVPEYEICTVCGWQNDPIQSDHPKMAGGANRMSLEEARRAWKMGLPVL